MTHSTTSASRALQQLSNDNQVANCDLVAEDWCHPERRWGPLGRFFLFATVHVLEQTVLRLRIALSSNVWLKVEASFVAPRLHVNHRRPPVRYASHR